MRTVVTPLRAPTGAAGLAAAATLDYLAGGRQQSLPTRHGESDLVGYFADQTPEGPGRWLGAGAVDLGLAGAVAREHLEALLRGEDPESGTPLVDARGSARRAEQHRVASTRSSWDQPRFTMQEAADLAGVSDRYLRRIAGRTRALLELTGGDASTLATIQGDGRAFLLAAQDADGRWRIERDELLRFMAARNAPAVTMGFDVTFSVPKSVSILWAVGDARIRRAVLDAFGCAVDAGVSYLESQAAVTGRGRERVRGQGLTAAAFTHATSRRLDPQLHAHVIVANMVQVGDGRHRALDGRTLYAHARASAYLAGAQLRHELTQRLGVSWQLVRTGTAEIDGVPRTAIDAVSQRRHEIETLAEDLGIERATGRRALALRSRPAKQSTSLESLRRDWTKRLAAVGFDATTLEGCVDRNVMQAPTQDARATLIDRLVGADGLTSSSATFTRQEVIEAIADWSLDRLDASAIEALADEALSDERILALVPLTRDADNNPSAMIPRFTTRTIVCAERAILQSFRAGIRVGISRVDPAVVAQALSRFEDLGEDQSAAAASLCRSGARIQCLVGAAGTGKTHTLRATAAALDAAGYRVVGTAVQGTAAEHLEVVTGIPSRTLASLLAAIDRDGPEAVADARTVLIVDEASAVGTLDLARIVATLEQTGARMLLSGDPAQHTSVRAGGAFRALVRRWPQHSARLTESRRQASPEMAAVQKATDELRRRDTDVALHRLVLDGRVDDAPTRDAACDAMVARWAADRDRGQDGPARKTCMVTDDHRTRRALIARARAHLQATGDISGPALVAAGQEFQVGDEVIARAPARDLHPPGAANRFVRNGTQGRVVGVHDVDKSSARLVVDFDGRGPIPVPASTLSEPLRPGVAGVLTHSYALTSHAAQGATFDTVHALATESTSPAGLYVAASRGREDVRIYTAARDRNAVEAHGPASWSTETGVQALARSVRNRGDDCLAVERDPTLLDRVDRPDANPPALELERDLGLDRDAGLSPDIEFGGGAELVAEGVGIAPEPVV